MAEILACCGYRCDLCPGYAGDIQSFEDKQKVSDGWFKYGGFRVPPEEISCQGCLSEEEPADQDCPVRPCANEKGLDNCGHCPDLPCDKLKTRMNFFEERLGDFSSVPEEDYDRYIKPYFSKNRLLKIRAKIGEK